MLAASVLALSACDTAEERAQKHFESGLELIQAGDVERGLVELRNVLTLDEFHTEGRKLYARTLREMGNVAESYQQYRSLVETSPDDYESRLALAEMAISAQNWEEVSRHGSVLVNANVDLEGTDIVDLTLRFRDALLAEDEPAVRELTREAIALIDRHPDDVTLRQIVVEGLVREGDLEGAADQLDAAIRITPDDRRLYIAKARLLAQLQDGDALEELLRQTVARFPDDNESKMALIRLYSSQGRTDEAEAFLRVNADATGKEGDLVTLISYLRQSRGNDAALEEIETRLAAGSETGLLTALKAAILFETDDRQTAIALLEAEVDGAEPSEQNDRFKVSLAKMLLAEGNEVGARQLVEEVLAHDGAQVEALKMSATWLIEDDQPEVAIDRLRVVLDQEPDDAAAMTLMADAHLRMGDTELAQDLLSLAVEASNNAPAESIRFARVLLNDERFRPAEDVLISALRNDPGNLQMLSMLGDVYVETEDWGRANHVETTLRRDTAEAAQAAADRLRLSILSRREGRDQAISYLESLAEGEEGAERAQLQLIRARLASGNVDEAVEIAKALRADLPDSAAAGLVLGNTYMAAGDYENAEGVFNEVVDAAPQIERAWIQLSRVQSALGRRDDARATVDRALAARPDAPNLLWAKASFLERANDIDGAIAIYEQLYETNSNSLVVANNLASLLATYREDEASKQRAFAVGRRLRGTDVPPFQDTYGWLLYRQGEFAEALTYLEPAAQALASDPIVQYHLAMTYLAVEREADALAQFRLAVELADENDPRPQMQRAREEIDRLADASVAQ
ncbi:tetratricopeptide repeat protein [Alphaproteobacteria bacterium GH1-50]|uniref:Tetratricopeptide repeat protein n=1 Tax=Kangsaoukella pontilimi TaxID=2691042 RepID=A0A7C9NC47_9RHOB|nr:tetratricopeptide repeat protein [Kangsaoukella pontilimi]MXQ06419.1 tetratricopeptide repeat protein [Kangsaoukella pontilimi]